MNTKSLLKHLLLLTGIVWPIIGAAAFGSDAPKTFAVVVAVADYKNFQPGQGDLNLTVNDARKFYGFLKTRIPSNQMRFLIDRNATRAQILKQIDYLFSFARPQDRVIFYFSGHGAPGMFLPYEADGRPATSLSHGDVKAAFKRCRASTKLCIADACHSGSITQSRGMGEQSVLRAGRSGIMVLMSSRDDETSLELGKLKQGLFSYYLIQALGGQADRNRDHIVNARELYDYVSQNVVSYASSLPKPHSQHPIAYGRFKDTMPIVNLR